MKKTILAILVFLFGASREMIHAQDVPSQDSVPFFIYGNAGIAYSTGNLLVSGGATFVSRRLWGLSADFQHYLFTATEKPSDYNPGLVVLGNGNPNDRIQSISVRADIEILTTRPMIRLGLEAGPAIDFYRRCHFESDPNSGFLSGNYIMSTSTQAFGALSFRIKSEFLFSKFFGMELALMGNVNGYELFGGIEASMLFGRLRHDLPKKNQDAEQE